MTSRKPPVPAAKVRPPHVVALERERLIHPLLAPGSLRLGVVLGPAGSGKTTLLAQLATALPGPVAWLWAEPRDTRSDTIIERLEQSFLAEMPELSGAWRGVAEAASDLDGWGGTTPTLFIDDFHTLVATPAEHVIEQLIRYTQDRLVVIVGSRAMPTMNLSRFRVEGTLVEVGPDDLRFRSWEVERLFRDFYSQPLPPEDLAELTRRTEGWAAGLQLFHLATQGRSAIARRRTLSALAARTSLVRDYLTRNILEDLPEDLRAFLLETCVLGRLSPGVCDRLLNRTDSAEVLAQLAARQMFIHTVEDAGEYRYHEVLRSYLEAMLVLQVGEPTAREKYVRAGSVLERNDALADALHAYCRGEAWDDADRVLRQAGEDILDETASRLDLLPRTVIAHDPWLRLAAARELRRAGRFLEASREYLALEEAFRGSAPAEIGRRERLAVLAWLGPPEIALQDWAGLVRLATIREPMAVRRSAIRLSGVLRQVVAGTTELLAGRMSEAASLLRAAAESPDASETMAAGARLGLALALLLSGEADGAKEAASAAEDAERASVPWLARLARASLALSDEPGGRSEAIAARLASEQSQDPWGASIAALLGGLGELRAGGNGAMGLQAAANGFRQLAAGVPESWAVAGLALQQARSSDPEAAETARRAEALARHAGVRGAQALAFLALSETDPNRGTGHRSLALALLEECHLGFVKRREAADLNVAPLPEPEVPVVIRCFGGFEIRQAGEALDLRRLRPKARRALRMLALNAGRPLHREVLLEALWPETDLETGSRNLQVVVSSLRHLLNGGNPVVAPLQLTRDGDAYRLIVPTDAVVDVAALEAALDEVKLAQVSGNIAAGLQAFRRAAAIHAGDLLPEEGPSDWIVAERERWKSAVAEATVWLIDGCLHNGRLLEAAAVCQAVLRIDRFWDSAWRGLIEAHERAGDRASAATARARYRQVLEDLGVLVP